MNDGYIGAPEDQRGYWDDKEPPEDEADCHPCGCEVGSDKGCDDEYCEVEAEKQMAYYATLFARSPRPYTREEVLDAYSDPCERHKRDSLLRDLEG